MFQQSVNKEEVAASMTYFSFSLEEFAREILDVISVLEDLKQHQATPGRNWWWILFWRYGTTPKLLPYFPHIIPRGAQQRTPLTSSPELLLTISLLRDRMQTTPSIHPNPRRNPPPTQNQARQTQIPRLEIPRKATQARNKICRQSRSRSRPIGLPGIYRKMERYVYSLARGMGFVELLCGHWE